MKTTLTSNGKLQIELTSETEIERAFMSVFRKQAGMGPGTVRVSAPQLPPSDAMELHPSVDPLNLLIEMDA